MRYFTLIIAIFILSGCTDNKKYYSYTLKSTGEIQGRFGNIETCIKNEQLANYIDSSKGSFKGVTYENQTTCKWQ